MPGREWRQADEKWSRGWHCGGGGNGTHIGVEMTEPATIRYTGGSDWVEVGDRGREEYGEPCVCHL